MKICKNVIYLLKNCIFLRNMEKVYFIPLKFVVTLQQKTKIKRFHKTDRPTDRPTEY